MLEIWRESKRIWRSLPSSERFQVRISAVLVGWFIQFFLGAVTFYLAVHYQYLQYALDVIEVGGVPPASVSALPRWQLSAMGCLFILWGAFRCARLSGEKLFGSLLLYWLGVEAFSIVSLVASGMPKYWLVDFLVAGVLTLIGGSLALRYALRKCKRDSVPIL